MKKNRDWITRTQMIDAADRCEWTLRQIALDFNGDPEKAHLAADKAMVLFVRALGFHEVANAFEAVEKRYA